MLFLLLSWKRTYINKHTFDRGINCLLILLLVKLFNYQFAFIATDAQHLHDAYINGATAFASAFLTWTRATVKYSPLPVANLRRFSYVRWQGEAAVFPGSHMCVNKASDPSQNGFESSLRVCQSNFELSFPIISFFHAFPHTLSVE